MFTFEGIFPEVKRRREKKNRLCGCHVVYRSHGGHECSDDITTLQRLVRQINSSALLAINFDERRKARASMNSLVRSLACFFPKSPAKGLGKWVER